MAQASDDEAEQAKVRKDFADAVNMTPAAIEKWLDTEESKSVGIPKDGDAGESVGMIRAGRSLRSSARSRPI